MVNSAWPAVAAERASRHVRGGEPPRNAVREPRRLVVVEHDDRNAAPLPHVWGRLEVPVRFELETAFE